MKDQSNFYPVLAAFSLMVEPDIKKMGDAGALQELQRLLDLEDPWILIRKNGPVFYTIARRFGLIASFDTAAMKRLDTLDPEDVCRLLVSWEFFRQSVLALDEAQSFVSNLNASFVDRLPPKEASV